MSESKWREMVAEVLGEHVPHVGWGTGAWNVECLASNCRFTAHGIGHVGEANAAFRNHLADALSPVLAQMKREWQAEALGIVRQVESDMAERALLAWRSADARRGLSDHEALVVHADALTRWSERFRMAFEGEYYRAEASGQEGERPVDWSRLHHGICPKCGEDKFIGHGPLCPDCYFASGQEPT